MAGAAARCRSRVRCIEQNFGPHIEQNSADLKYSAGSVASWYSRARSGSRERANWASQSKANRARLRAQVGNRERAPSRFDERVLVRGPNPEPERRLLQYHERLLLRVPERGPYRGQEFPLLSGGWSLRGDEARCQRLEARSQKCGNGGMRKT